MQKFMKVNFIILGIICILATTSFAEENTNPDLYEHINKIDELETQKQDLQNQTDEYNSQLEFVNEELSGTLIEVSELTQNIYDKQVEIDEAKTKLEILSNRIDETNKKLETSTKVYLEQKKLLEKRLVAMYEIGETSYLDLLLNSKSISDFLSNYYYISEIATTDAELLSIVREQKNNIEKMKSNLEKNEKDMENSKNTLEKANIAMSNMIIIKNQRIEQLNETELALQQQIEEYQSQLQEIESEIRLLSLSSNNAEYVGGTLTWPVPGYTRITSPFGMRTHPITGVYKLHTGTDISAPYGATFVAANDGIVSKAGYNGAYGNMVIIDHGGGISTLYAHGSEILVEAGQIITKGTPVLKVGSTGYSTGPHAHFEIRINGEYVNPMDYLLQNENNAEENPTEKVELDSKEENN